MEGYRSKQTAKSRWKIAWHVIVAALRFRSPAARRSEWRHFSSTIVEPDSPIYEPSRVSFQALDPSSDTSSAYDPCGAPPQQSRWRIVKHVIVATLRLLSTIGRDLKKAAALPHLELKSIISSSGKVYKVVHRQTGQTYALKEFLHDSSQRQQITSEIQILKQLDHPNLVKCYDVVFADADGLVFLLLEPLDRGFPSATSEFDLVSLAHQLLLGLNYLHRKQISHGDIKPSNIFVNHTGQLKLLYSGKTLSKTPLLSAEIGAVHDGFSWDIWSVGLCILKFSKCLNWFDGGARFNQDVVDLKALKLDSSLSHMDEDSVPSSSSSHSQNEGALLWKPSTELLRLLSSCMHTDVLKRWTAEQLVNHPFFNQLPLKKEVLIPPLKKENELFHEKEELMSSLKKKSKISIEDGDRGCDVESSKDPTTRVLPHVVPERCIEHCKLLFPDCDFEKDKLVLMWIAEECIELGVTKRMEDVGNLYFDALVQEKVIVPSKFDILHRQMKYKFNTCQVSDGLLKQFNYLRINGSHVGEIYHKETLHLSWQCRRLDRYVFDALKNFKQLRTLIMHEDCSDSINQLPNDIFVGLRLLKTLDMSRTSIEEIPGSIGKLESLRYLDISETPIKRLPESLGRLYCLQTLNLKACFGLVALPRGLGRLVNLRHLDLDIVSQLKSMPRGMGNLIKLQTLRAFIVGKNDGCGIGELKDMNEITGSFCISRLENVSNAEEAKEAALSDKKYIDKLELRWYNYGNDDFHDTTEILESLQPHFHLKELQLTFYGGLKLPSWISNPSYVDLASITLYKCINCDILPSIGELPSLKILHIMDMGNVRNISAVFCRNSETKALNAFPMLEKLTLDNMLTLEEWSGVEYGDFPCLRYVSIRYCPKLRVLPSLSHLCSLEHLEISHCTQLISLPEGSLPRLLEYLIISGCPEINERCRKDEGLDWSKIASVGNIWIDLEKISLD
ncbi:hypothetical protein C2S53_008181 [Perilla frutescens var. hirtella]|uniref:Protein kinase domain-containing protein n=1 Tax=Perilla frutescens var. hirtella TaxID=608512 RepID=A0AAD4P9Z9_PERFH|nr:hypothetical protein C2S53_008181 [Perilla frutescens var. hirtella]